MRFIAVTLVALGLATGSASADDEQLRETLVERAQGCSVAICIPGRYFLRYLRNADFALDSDGSRHGQVNLGVQRWRIRPRLSFSDKLYVEAEADLVSGQLFGDRSSIGQDFLLEPRHELDAFTIPDPANLRQLYVSWTTPIGLFRLGHMTSNFGYGLVANNGDDEANDVFDDPNLGDIVERFLFVTKPFKFLDSEFGNAFIVAGGFDVVFRDDNASLIHGDFAMQGVVSLAYRTDWINAGIYMAFRDQEDEDGDTLDAQAYDIFLEFTKTFDDMDARLKIGIEAALIKAETNRAALEQAPDGLDILAGGFVFRADFDLLKLGLNYRVEVGYASGDANRNDSAVSSFTFDPGYHVGMLLYREVLGRITANTVERIRDPNVSGTPPKGNELVSTDGAITNTVYIYPVIRYKADFGLGADLGVLAAWSASDFTDPWQSAQNGGYNFNHLGKALSSDSRYLGTEVDAGLSYTLNVQQLVAFTVGFQAGVFIPGSALEAPEGIEELGTVYKLRTSFEVEW